MSTFGSVVVMDVPAGAGCDVDELEFRPFGQWLRGVGEVDPDPDAIEGLLTAGPVGSRCAMAEDFDEYGARFRVMIRDSSGWQTIYDAYVVNADPADGQAIEESIADLEEDPRAREVTGPQAARRAADSFGVDARAMLATDASWRVEAWEGIGVVGGPFPWWEALGLPWPTA